MGSVRAWPVLSLPKWSRRFVLAVPVAAAIGTGFAAASTPWRVSQVPLFAALLACGAVAIEAMRQVRTPHGTAVRDMQPVWYLVIAVLLPPVYAALAPIPLTALKQWRVRRNLVHRRVFSAAANSLGYGCASVVFHISPAVGSDPGSGTHALAWTAAVAACELVGRIINTGLIATAVRLSDPVSRIRDMLFTRDTALSDLIELSLGVITVLVVSIDPVLMICVLPSVVLQRRFLMHAQLVAEARIDSKTGLLNAAAWQREAVTELSRASRGRARPSVAMIDVDHFKRVNDTHGHLAGDLVLRAIADRLKAQLRADDLIGRFGGEEFAILLPGTGSIEAGRIAERLRASIADEPIAIGDGRSDGLRAVVTISVGVAAIAAACDLNDLIAAADSAVYRAKNAGRNRVCCQVSDDAAQGAAPS